MMSSLAGYVLRIALLWTICAGGHAGFGADAKGTAAGYWAGSIALPPGPLEVRVELRQESDQSWTGALDVPAQGVRAFKLNVTIQAESVLLKMSGVPGEPTYAGTLSADGSRITGNFTDGGARFPFALQRTTAEAAKAGPPLPPGIPGQGAAGHWLGALNPVPNLQLRLALDVGNSGTTPPDAVLISLDQQNARMPVTTWSESDRKVRFELQRPVAAFEGTMNADGSELAGTWIQGNRRTPLVFKRQPKSAAIQRPQEPVKPYPYREHEVTVENRGAGITLAGTLTVPPGAGPHPAVVLITGSGPQDRDQQVAGHRTFLVLADQLTRAGIAVLRCDDRGTGKSTGQFHLAIQSDFVDDTLASVAWLRARSEIDPRRVGLIGHSEGAMVAPRAAAKSSEIAYIVLLAGPGLPMNEIMLRQARDVARAMGKNEESIAENEALQREMLGILRSDLPTTEVIDALRKRFHAQTAKLSPEQRRALGLPEPGAPIPQLKLAESPWLRDALRIDPQEALRRVTCPVLALTGAKDLQVAPAENLAAIEAALLAGGNSRYMVKELPGLNHLFQTCRTGAPFEYAQIEETFSPAALQEISQWILETARPTQ